MQNNAYAKLYNPSEYLAVDEITVLFKGAVVFKQYIPKNIHVFASKFTKYVAYRVHIQHKSIYGEGYDSMQHKT
jgi:hypothetical protein